MAGTAACCLLFTQLSPRNNQKSLQSSSALGRQHDTPGGTTFRLAHHDNYLTLELDVEPTCPSAPKLLPIGIPRHHSSRSTWCASHQDGNDLAVVKVAAISRIPSVCIPQHHHLRNIAFLFILPIQYNTKMASTCPSRTSVPVRWESRQCHSSRRPLGCDPCTRWTNRTPW